MGARTPLRPAGGPGRVDDEHDQDDWDDWDDDRDEPEVEPDTEPEVVRGARVVGPVEGRGSTGHGGPLIGGRYALTAARAAQGPVRVFLGTDTRTGAQVLVRQAGEGPEARAELRREARLLARLEGRGLAPRPLQLIERDDSLLLVQQHLPGQSLDSWVAARLPGDGTPGGLPGVPWAEARPMALALLDLVEQVHAAGLVLRGLAPDRVIVLPDGRPLLADLAAACPAGAVATPAVATPAVATPAAAPPTGRPGYRAPEQDTTAITLALYGSYPAEPEADRFALGGLFFLLATGHHPLLPPSLPRSRPEPERLARWLALASREGLTARRLSAAVLGLRAEQPQRRWGTSQVREALGAPPEQANEPDRQVERLLHDGLRHLAASVTPHRPDRLWPSVPTGPALAVLARAAVTAGLPSELRELSARTARTAAAWLERRCATAGTAARLGGDDLRALLDAADVLGDHALAARAERLAGRLPLVAAEEPVAAEEKDAHGTAAGDRALAAGRRLLDRQSAPDAPGSQPCAGDGAFLLDLAEATGEARFRAGAEAVARALVARASLHDGRLLTDPDGAGPGGHPETAADTLAFLLRLRYGTPGPAAG
ncbi:serine/threonine protein kinase [Kitasatospora sp. MAA4]|uniref:hypothetical protein n=1 Tax=Kitasatospora sp. MAA4 TaxID=3035093 RepID=UPI0024759562|nr:hypothetical protein [Kitasatospora sp. MAA4]MDH6131924.1 serine/threonine protein kinase [Kitasatospora sp. MAA4]